MLVPQLLENSMHAKHVYQHTTKTAWQKYFSLPSFGVLLSFYFFSFLDLLFFFSFIALVVLSAFIALLT